MSNECLCIHRTIGWFAYVDRWEFPGNRAQSALALTLSKPSAHTSVRWVRANKVKYLRDHVSWQPFHGHAPLLLFAIVQFESTCAQLKVATYKTKIFIYRFSERRLNFVGICVHECVRVFSLIFLIFVSLASSHTHWGGTKHSMFRFFDKFCLFHDYVIHTWLVRYNVLCYRCVCMSNVSKRTQTHVFRPPSACKQPHFICKFVCGRRFLLCVFSEWYSHRRTPSTMKRCQCVADKANYTLSHSASTKHATGCTRTKANNNNK